MAGHTDAKLSNVNTVATPVTVYRVEVNSQNIGTSASALYIVSFAHHSFLTHAIGDLELVFLRELKSRYEVGQRMPNGNRCVGSVLLQLQPLVPNERRVEWLPHAVRILEFAEMTPPERHHVCFELMQQHQPWTYDNPEPFKSVLIEKPLPLKKS